MKAAQAEAHADNARLFRAVAEILLDASIPADGVRDAVFRCVPAEELGRLIDKSKALDRGETESLVELLKTVSPTFAPSCRRSWRRCGSCRPGRMMSLPQASRRCGTWEAPGGGRSRRRRRWALSLAGGRMW